MMIELKELAATCEDCVPWLPICKGECCNRMFFMLEPPRRVHPGMLVQWKQPDKDMQFYNRLHGCKVEGDTVSFLLFRYVQEKGRILVYARCEALTKDNKCKLHPDKKPLFCQQYNKETARDGNAVLTKNCRFNY